MSILEKYANWIDEHLGTDYDRKTSRQEHSVYRPLDQRKKEIRLLIVDPHAWSHGIVPNNDRRGRIKCRLRHVSLLKSPIPRYKAISWCWGDASKRRSIVLDEHAVEIPENAWKVIRSLCRELGHSKVWLDAVCINQADIEERGQQVAMMRDIYSNAESVPVWLKGGGPLAHKAVQSIESLVAHCKAETQHLRDLGDQFFDSEGYMIRGDFPLPDCNWPELCAYYEEPWFTRVWIIQEVLLAKTAVCYRNKYEKTNATVTAWADVSLAAQWLVHRNFYRYTTKLARGTPTAGIENAANLWRRQHSIMKLHTSLEMIGSFEATDPLDKIYSLFGLFQDSGTLQALSSSLTPDYSRSLEDVYTAAARAALEERKSERDQLLVLDIAQSQWPLPTDDGTARGWPSWVPRWDLGRGALSRRLQRQYAADATYRQPATSRSAHSRSIGLRGLAVDRVTRMGNPFTETLARSTELFMAEMNSFEANASHLLGDDTARAFALAGGCQSTSTDSTYAAELVDCYRDCKAACELWNYEGVGFVVPAGHEASEVTCYCPVCRVERQAKPFRDILWSTNPNRRYLVTERGYVGVSHPAAEEGDYVCILFGSRHPFVLRKDGSSWNLVGSAYMHGIMTGEYIHCLERQGRLDEDIQIFDIQ